MVIIELTKLKAGSFYKIPTSLFLNDHIRLPSSLIIYGILLSLSNIYSTINVGNERLAKTANIHSLTTISNSIKELYRADVINVVWSNDHKKTFRTITPLVQINSNKYISVPKAFISMDELTNKQKLILSIIYTDQFLNGGHCNLTNSNMGRMMHCKSRAIAYQLSQLVSKGLINKDLDEQGKRLLEINEDYFNGLNNLLDSTNQLEAQDETDYWQERPSWLDSI